MSDCTLIRLLFGLNTRCCDSCHEDFIYGISNVIYLPLCEWGGVGEDIPFLELCCSFNDFMNDLTKEQKQKIREAKNV